MTLIHDPATVSVYALDSLPDEERDAFENHILTCAECLGELDSYREVMAALVPDGPPPPGVWARVEFELDGTETLQDSARPRHKQRRLVPRLGWSVAGAAVVASAVWIGALLPQDSAMSGESIVAAATAAAAEPGSLAADFMVEDSAVATIVLGGDGLGFVIPDDRLTPLDAGRTYQLWVITPDGNVISGGLLGSVPAPATFTWHGDVAGFALTREIAGGVVESAGDVVAVVEGLDAT